LTKRDCEGKELNALPSQYLSLLIAIQENPFGTIEELAGRAGVSKPTAAKKTAELMGLGSGAIRRRQVEQKAYFTVKPILNYLNLSCESVDVLLETDGLKGVLKLEEVATKHPYTVYRSRCYGALNGLLMQFRTPVGTRPMIEELVRRLSDEGVVTSYRFLPTGEEPTVYTSLRIEGWDPKTLTWKFDWEDWFGKDIASDKPLKNKGTIGQSLSWLTRNDLFILQELMKGARRKNRDFIEALEKNNVPFTPQTFSRRCSMIRDQCIEGYRVTFDPAVFDIYSNILVLGSGNKTYLQKLRTKLQKKPIPFESTMRVSGSELFWFVRLQPSHLSPLLTNLLSNLEQMTVCLLDYAHSLLYNIWPDTLDESAHKWRTDKQFMIDNVLQGK
jgi:hypothetical protein